MICRLLFPSGKLLEVTQPARNPLPPDVWRRRVEALVATPLFADGPHRLPPLIEWDEDR